MIFVGTVRHSHSHETKERRLGHRFPSPRCCVCQVVFMLRADQGAHQSGSTPALSRSLFGLGPATIVMLLSDLTGRLDAPIAHSWGCRHVVSDF